MASTTVAPTVDFKGIAIHLGRYCYSVIAFLQLPTDVAWRRTVSAIQAANTATFMAINLYVQLCINVVRQFINNSWNSIVSSVQQASTTVIAVVESVKLTVGLGLDYLFSAATNATKAFISLFVDYLPTIAVGFYSEMRKEVTFQHMKTMNMVLLASSLVWFYLRRCVEVGTPALPAKDGQVTSTRKWRRRFQVVLRELASLLVLSSVLSYAAMPEWTAATIASWLSAAADRLSFLSSIVMERVNPVYVAVVEGTNYHLGNLIEECVSRLPPILERIEPVYGALGGDSIRLQLIKFAGDCFERLPPRPDWHPWVGMSRDVGIGVLAPIILGGHGPSPSPICAASNTSSTLIKSSAPPTIPEPALSYQGDAMVVLPFLMYVIAAWDLVMLVRRRQRKGQDRA
ncbi:uncharacterized protein PODANS_2_13500 [Podospora anserina S mat+]|uniref:Podospora anserina S mat+ genomic DNA chromosome 2, supercontig 3 n=1 Tax=Podospora anserina (strain S / ATCC MYA-4624 / DSM 980 / FGSC 10383) TaxID=515849 RepID=B2AC49_PODAN|nr:uncharacterized protein PODANS_2_13500 [Podospora anserina S mat+]CAP60950.1 unnamed protein product [Podospora anserina S mat+]CDP26478.1 Putative protein of unknown function [Podospora anserina S mat+]